MGPKREGRTPKGTWGVRNSCLCALIMMLAACTGSSKQDVIESEGLVLTGSVGDGPIVGATIRVEDADGELVFEGLSDETANYRLAIPDGTRLPVIVRVSGGTDLVTSRPADFEMQSVAFSSGPITLNVSPYTTLAVKTAQCLGELNPGNIATAWDLIDQTLNFGWARDTIADPMGEPIDEQNITTVLVSNEALGELIRRTAADLSISSTPLTTDGVINHLACFIAGNVRSVPESDPRLSFTLTANAAAIGVEVIAGTLMVDDADAMGRLDSAMRTVLPGAPGSVLDLTPPQQLLDQTSDRIGILLATGEPALIDFAMALAQATPGSARAELTAVTNPENLTELNDISQDLALADSAELTELMNHQTVTPRVSFTAETPVVLSGESTRLSWATSNAETCRAGGGWSGDRTLNGAEQTGPLTAGTEFTLSCAGRGGVVTARTFVAVQTSVSSPAPTPTPTPNPGPDPQPSPDPGPEAIPVPAITFTASSNQVEAGSSVQLSWTTSNASSCSASGGWSGNRGTAGNEIINGISNSTTFTLTCSGPGGNALEMLTVTARSSVVLNWVAPDENEDGTPLTDLAGYRIYYGTSSRDYTGMVELNDPFDTSHTLSLASGDYYVAMTALDQEGNESAYSNEVLKTAP